MRYEILDRLPVVSTGGRHVYIWGTGNTSICYQEGFARENWLKIYGYGVNDESQHGGYFGENGYSQQRKLQGTKMRWC